MVVPGGARHAPPVQVRLTDDPVKVLSAAGRFLAGRPVHHNVVLSLLSDRADIPEPGRYGWVAGGEGFAGIGGVIFNSPLGFPATVTPMVAAAADRLGEVVATAWPDLAGVTGDAGTAAALAGAFATASRAPARPVEGQRLYRLRELAPPPEVPGSARLAGPGDRRLVAAFLAGFYEDVGETHRAAGTGEDRAARLVASGRLWLWENPAAEVGAGAGAGNASVAPAAAGGAGSAGVVAGGAGAGGGVRVPGGAAEASGASDARRLGGPVVAMAHASAPHAGVARVGPVYTPPGARGRGYGAAATAAATAAILAAGATPILYTQLDNPTSNALYQRLGYECVGEVLRYAFG